MEVDWGGWTKKLCLNPWVVSFKFQIPHNMVPKFLFRKRCLHAPHVYSCIQMPLSAHKVWRYVASYEVFEFRWSSVTYNVEGKQFYNEHLTNLLWTGLSCCTEWKSWDQWSLQATGSALSMTLPKIFPLSSFVNLQELGQTPLKAGKKTKRAAPPLLPKKTWKKNCVNVWSFFVWEIIY